MPDSSSRDFSPPLGRARSGFLNMKRTALAALVITALFAAYMLSRFLVR